MILETVIGIAIIYGLYYYLQGIQELPIEVKKNWPPQDIETWTEEKNQQRYFGQIILLIVAIYLMFVII